MKYCSRPFEFMFVTRSFDERDVPMIWPCGWVNVANAEDTDLTKYSVEEIWHSATFEKVRESIRDGSFRYCNCHSCPFISNNSLEEYDEEEFIKKTIPQKYPLSFDLAYDRTCNHACPSCRQEIYKSSPKVLEENKIIEEKLLPYLNKAKVIDSNGQGDFFASKANLGIFKKLQPENKDLEIIIETNGTLFDEAHWSQIEHLSKYFLNVNITPNSFDRKTYAYLNGGFDLLDRLEENLLFVKSLREKGDIDKFTLITVVQDTNVKEIPSFIKKCFDVYNADQVTVRPIYKWNFLTEEEFWFKNVANPLHPYYQYYEELRNSEIMKHPKVYNWGIMNEEPARKHPAYRYQDIADDLLKLFQIENLEEHINNYFKQRNISEIILYGNDTLGRALQNVFSRNGVNIRISKVLYKENLQDYHPKEDEVILISNYHFAEPISRDLKFYGWMGEKILANEWINELLRES